MENRTEYMLNKFQYPYGKVFSFSTDLAMKRYKKEILEMGIPCISQKNLTLLIFQLWSWRTDVNKHTNMSNNNFKSLDTN